MMGLVILVPNVALTVIGIQAIKFMPTSVTIYLIYFAVLIGFAALLPSGVGFSRSLEVVAYSGLPFLIAAVLLACLSVFGEFGMTVGQILTLIGMLMGWVRLFVGLEVMSGSRWAALSGALLAPVAAFVAVGFSGLLLRLLGLA